jgi:pyruvate dehydrogenase E1 component alpha subunit
MAGVFAAQRGSLVAGQTDAANRVRAIMPASVSARPAIAQRSAAPAVVRRHGQQLVCKAAATTAPPKTATTSTSTAVISPEVAKDLYRDMFLGREFEEMCAQMYYRGKMFGFVHLYSGQEACSTGVIRLLNKVGPASGHEAY